MLILTMAALAAACAPQSIGNGDEPVSSDDILVPTPTVDHAKYELSERAIVETADPMFLESFPLQVRVQIIGSLPDGCTTIYRTESTRSGDRFDVRIFTLRERDAFCTQALVPFESSTALEVYGLSAGTYQINVYDVTTEFTFTQDNIIQGCGACN